MASRPGAVTMSRAAVAQPVVEERAGRLVLRRLDAWSVLKFALLFYFCLLLIGMLTLAVVWFVLQTMGVFDQITKFVGQVGLSVTFPVAVFFKWAAIAGLVGVVLWSILTVLVTLLFNLVNDITGGIAVTLGEIERRRR